MTPHIALKFDFDHIALLVHGHTGDWHTAGKAELASNNLAAELGALRNEAERLAGKDFISLLILPDDQILYSEGPSLDLPLRSAAAGLLDGATPYTLDQLVFDVTAKDAAQSEIQIASVAVETLAEAESFAAAYGFRPVAFTAPPDPRTFSGYVNLGMAERADNLLKGATLALPPHALRLSDSPLIRIFGQSATQTAEAGPTAPSIVPIPIIPPAKTPTADLPMFEDQDTVHTAVPAAPLVNRLALWMTLVLVVLMLMIALLVGPRELASFFKSGEANQSETIIATQTAPSSEEAMTRPTAEYEPSNPLQAGITQISTLEIFEATGVWSAAPDVPQIGPLTQIEALYAATTDQPIEPADPVIIPMRSALSRDTISAINTASTRPGLGRLAAKENLAEPEPPAADSSEIVTNESDSGPAILAAEARRADLIRTPPRPRPAGFSVQIERAKFNGFTRAELTRTKPTQRPQSLQEAAKQAAEQVAAASLATTLDPDADRALETPLAEEDKPTLVASAVPKQRPANMSAIIAKVKAAPQATTTAVASASRISTTNSVSRAATQVNAMPIKRINLLGIFGKASKPQALVRSRSGKTQKVAVGDRLDGGRVIAIGKDQLIYRKGSRDIQLNMPRL